MLSRFIYLPSNRPAVIKLIPLCMCVAVQLICCHCCHIVSTFI